MLMTKERPRGIRTLRGWAISVLQEAGAIRECEEHAWATDRADPHARDRAFEIAEQDPPSGDVPRRSGLGSTAGPGFDRRSCPECPP
jgi:hypothetical protein